jgi:5-formyltetrahydrofolate cyclo-ligase
MTAPEKSRLREELIKARKAVLPAEKELKDAAVFEKLLALPEFARAKLVLTYVSSPIEVDTRRLISYCVEKGIEVAEPKTENRDMFFVLMNRDVKVVDFGGSICIVPALAYNAGNYRVGFGGGFYDRFLSGYDGFSAGLCYREFIREFRAEGHDCPVDVVIHD